MKKILTPTLHGYLDYVTVVLFLAASSLLGLTGMAGIFAYVLAIIHLAMTLLTDFPLGIYKLVPFNLHGWIERGVGPMLVVVPYIFGFTDTAIMFYVGIGIVIIIVGLLTDYQAVESAK
jgi:hypothetical protein